MESHIVSPATFASCLTIGLFSLMALSSCQHVKPPAKQMPDTLAVRKTLDSLYQSFSLNAKKEPNWQVMEALTLPGATFISAPSPDEKREGVDIKRFINSYRSFLRHSPLLTSGYREELLQVHIQRVHTVATAIVIFKGVVPGDERPRKSGMDNIQLLLDKGSWKITAFTTQSESVLVSNN